MQFKINLGIDIVGRSGKIEDVIRSRLFYYVKLNLSEDRLQLWKEYLEETYKLDYSILYLFKLAIDNLIFEIQGKEYIGRIDSNVLIPDTKINLSFIINMIDKGNLEMYGTKLITNAFQYIEKNGKSFILRSYGLL